MRSIQQATVGLATLAAGVLCAAPAANAVTIYGVTTDNTLFNFDSATPGTISSALAISGFVSNNENIRGIDFRPATGQLYAIGSFGQLYTVNTATAVLTPVGSGIGAGNMDGTSFGFDFNPTIDRIRVTSNTDTSLVVNPISGALQTTAPDLVYGAGDLNVGVNPNIVGSAYTNSVLGVVPSSTTLLGIDSGIDTVATQAAATSVLTTVGPLLTVNTSDQVGFDIFSPAEGNNTAFASLTPTGGSVSNLYTVNLATGAAVLVGQIDGGTLVTDIAAVPVPEPVGFAAVVAAATALFVRGRRRI